MVAFGLDDQWTRKKEGGRERVRAWKGGSVEWERTGKEGRETGRWGVLFREGTSGEEKEEEEEREEEERERVGRRVSLVLNRNVEVESRFRELESSGGFVKEYPKPM